MGIEPTNLSDILMTPEVSAEPGNRGSGRDFAAFLNVLAPDAQNDVGEPTVVGNPTQETNVETDSIQTGVSDAEPEMPLQTLMMIADKLGVKDKSAKQPATAAPVLSPEDEAMQIGNMPIPPVIPPTGDLQSRSRFGISADDADDLSDMPMGKQADPSALPVLPEQAMQTGPRPDLLPSETPEISLAGKDPALRGEGAIAAGSKTPVPATPDMSAIKSSQADSDEQPDLPSAFQATRPASPEVIVPGVVPSVSEQKAQASMPAAPHATGRQRALEKAADNSRIVSPDKAPASGKASAPDKELPIDAPQPANPGASVGADAADIQPPTPVLSERHALLASSGQTPSVATPAPSATPVHAQHQQVLENLLVGNAVENQWVDRLSQDVQTLISSDNREARLHLRPRELGDLSIKLEMHEDRAKVHFTVETAAAQALIAEASPRLQAMLENKGVKLEQSSVDIGGNGTGKGGNGGSGQDAQPFMAKAPPSALVAVARRVTRLTAFERYA